MYVRTYVDTMLKALSKSVYLVLITLILVVYHYQRNGKYNLRFIS